MFSHSVTHGVSQRLTARQTVGGYDPLYCPKFTEMKSRYLPEMFQKHQFITYWSRSVISGNNEPLKNVNNL